MKPEQVSCPTPQKNISIAQNPENLQSNVIPEVLVDECSTQINDNTIDLTDIGKQIVIIIEITLIVNCFINI